MERRGRYAALALTGSIACYIVLLGFWLGVWQSQLMKLALALGSYTAIFFPLAWMAGRQYDIAKHRSLTDGLTGAYNRSFIQKACPDLFVRAMKGNKRISLSIIDVNDFKMINDSYGHLTGDRVLKQIAEAMRQNVDKGEIVVRFGGDEFILLCPYADRRSTGELQTVINRTLEQLSLLNGHHLSVSIGTAVFPEDGHTLETLMECADRRMYKEKHPVQMQPSTMKQA